MSKTDPQHTSGPWEAIKAAPFERYWIQRAEAPHVVVATAWTGDSRQPDGLLPAEANAHRIVACVNACEGIPTDGLEDGAIRLLLDAARSVLEIADGPGLVFAREVGPAGPLAVASLRAAVALAKGIGR